MRMISAPLLLIQGDKDRTVDYASGAHAMFAMTSGATVPPDLQERRPCDGIEFRAGLDAAKTLDQDWFEDPVWRKERINAINAHFITAFLDRYLKNDESRAAYLDVAVAESDAGVWPRMRRPRLRCLQPGYAGNHGVEGFPAQSCGRFGIAASESGLGP